ncbi:MAG TPA: hypothetical protein VMV86_00030 [Methanosarcinales archaeon]|nr:hypothetical protein [Methanosarcinales archaeon]
MGIDWKKMESGSYITIEEGTPVVLLLKAWKEQTKFTDEKTGEVKPGLVFEVWEEDGEAFTESTKKEYTCTAIKAVKQFKPFIEKAEAEGKDYIKVNITAVGKGPKRLYSIKGV